MCPYTRVAYTCGHCRYTVRAWCETYERTHIRCGVRVVALERRYVCVASFVLPAVASFPFSLAHLHLISRFSLPPPLPFDSTTQFSLPPRPVLLRCSHLFLALLRGSHFHTPSPSISPSTSSPAPCEDPALTSPPSRYACGDCQPSAYAPWMEALKLSLPTQRRLNKAWRRKPPRPVWASCP
jgi:hypothetical protein